VDDEFLFVNDGSTRLWENRIRGYHLPIHMISDSWTTQNKDFQKLVFVEFPVSKGAISLKQHQQFFLELAELIHQKVYGKVISIQCVGFIQ
jgi:hypothetical protein